MKANRGDPLSGICLELTRLLRVCGCWRSGCGPGMPGLEIR